MPFTNFAGMRSQDINALMGNAIHYRQILGNEDIHRSNAQATQTQNAIENYFRNLTHQLANRKEDREVKKDERDANKLNTSVHSFDGKEYAISTDAAGNIVKKQELGAHTSADTGHRLLKLPDGSLKFFGPNDNNIPNGAVPVENTGDMLKQSENLDKIERTLTTMKDDKGNNIDIDPTAMAGYAETYNKFHPNSQLVKVPPGPKVWGLPYTGTDAKWVKVPKSAAGIMSMDPTTVVGRDSKTGADITIKTINDKAKITGYQPEDILKFLGLVQ